MKLSANWEKVLGELPENVRRGLRYYALSDLDKVTIMVSDMDVAVRAHLEAELSKAEIQLRDELKRRIAEMTGDNHPVLRPVRFPGKPEEEEWSYSTLRLVSRRG